jgi:opacity protein-like surface antigen
MHSRDRHRPALHCSAGIIALVLVLGLVAVPDVWAGKPHLREGVIFGVTFGASRGQATLFPGEETTTVGSDWETGVTPQVRLGYAVVKNHLLVTVANQQWLYEQGVLADDKLRINTQNWTLALVWCPFNPNKASGGIHVQAGIGYANSRLTLVEPIEEDEHGNTFEEVFKKDEFGTAYTVGVGYEFRLVKSLAAGLAASYIYQPIDGTIFEDSSFVPINLTLNWYW